MTKEDALLDAIYDEVTAADVNIDDSVVSLLKEIVRLRAERDALRVRAEAAEAERDRLTELAALSGEVFAFAITDSKMPNLETRRQLHDAVKRALDAALAVQP